MQMIERVLLQDNLWFVGDDHRGKNRANYERNEQSMIPFEPALGRTSSDDWTSKRKELKLLCKATGDPQGGRVALAFQWQHPFDLCDTNLHGWIRHVLPRFPRLKWFIFYDPILSAERKGIDLHPEGFIDYTKDPFDVVLDDDLRYLEHFLYDERYLRFGGLPVLWVWAMHGGVRFWPKTDVWRVVGDVFGLASGLERSVENVDVASGFTAALPGPTGRFSVTGNLESRLVPEWKRWSMREGRPIIPALSLQYDDHAFREAEGDGVEPTQILARDRAEIERALLTAKANVHPDYPYVWIGTLNNWAEGTSIAPTKRRGPAFLMPEEDGIPARIGHYHREHLKALRVLFS
jgi:hypothetical protein